MEAAREGGRVRHRTIARLGEASRLRESGELERIIAALQVHADTAGVVHAGDLTADSAPGFGAIAVLWTPFCRLGLREHFGSVRGHRTSASLADTVFVMIANRLLAPSKRHSIIVWIDRDDEFAGRGDRSVVGSVLPALDTIADTTAATEDHLFARLT